MHARTLSPPRAPPHWRGLADYVREHLNVAARALRAWAHAWQGLRERPLLRAALLEGEPSCAVAKRGRLLVGRVPPETEAAFLDSVRGCTVRAVEAVVRALRQAEGKHTETRDQEDSERVGMRIRFPRRQEILRQAACESRVARGHCVPYREIDAFQAHAPGRVLKAATVRSGIERLVTVDAPPARGRDRRREARGHCVPRAARGGGFLPGDVRFSSRHYA